MTGVCAPPPAADVRVGCGWQVLVDHTLEYELTIGNCIDSCRWDEKGNSLVITATNGYLWCFEFTAK